MISPIAALLAGAVLLAATVNGHAESTRVFTSSDGKKLPAILVRADGKSATLLRARDNKEFTVPLTRLSEADQAYIRKWVERHAPAPHPLGWKRLRIHNDGPEVHAGAAPIFGSGFGSVDANPEYYLPPRAWMQISDPMLRDGLVQFDGESDWFITRKDDQSLIQTRKGTPPRPFFVRLDPNEVNPRPDKELESLIDSGVTVELAADSLGLFGELDADPASMILEVINGQVPWKQVPRSVQALHIRAGGADLDLEGIDALARLEYLNLNVTRQEVTGSRLPCSPEETHRPVPLGHPRPAGAAGSREAPRNPLPLDPRKDRGQYPARVLRLPQESHQARDPRPWRQLDL